MKVKTKSVKTGKIIEKNFRADEKVIQAIVDTKTMQYLYNEGEALVFMDTEDYSQMNVPIDRIGDKKNFLVEGNEVSIMMYEGEILDIDLLPQVNIKVKEAEPGLKGNTASGATKKVQLETGLELDVPLFINQGDIIVVDTRSGEYISRAE
jgi:elongation factor P